MIRLRPSGADEVLIKRVRDWYEPGPGVFIEPQALFSPALLFTGTTNGAWYDTSDLTTLYRDAAGTLPVTAVEQPVGLMLDKSKGLVLGPELVTNGGFSNGTTGWTAFNAVISNASNTLKVDDSANAGFNSSAVQQLSLTLGKWYKLTVDVVSTDANGWNFSLSPDATSVSAAQVLASGTTAGTKIVHFLASTNTYLYISVGGTGISYFDNISVRELPGNHAFNSSGNSANFPVLSARYNQYLNTETLATQNVTTLAASYKLAFTGTGSITLSGTATGTYSAGTHTITCTAGTLTSTVSGTVTQADLRVANDALNQPAYQRVNTSTDYDTVGFKPYLRFNGTNQWLQTNSIDFTYGDKMFVSAGVRKLSDGNYKALAELSTSPGSSGTFWLAAPGGLPPSTGYSFETAGTAASGAFANSGYAQPITNVLSGIGNISGDQAILRVNGTQAAISTADQGTGNYGNYPLYIGARAGSSLWFNGRLYGMVVAGKPASDSEIGQTETYLNQKTGAY